VLLVAVVLVVATVTAQCVARARRLDRLHVRTDAARAALEAALDRRAEVALRVAAAPGPRPPPGLRAAALAAAAAAVADRETAENALGRRLAELDRTVLDPVLHAELADAEQLVILARRVHNDAVRDTLGLRSRRLVRWLRLAGTAPVPAYFEIADPDPPRSGVAQQAPARPPR
jgi:hypothetical protein